MGCRFVVIFFAYGICKSGIGTSLPLDNSSLESSMLVSIFFFFFAAGFETFPFIGTSGSSGSDDKLE
jgi:hypothetical protein